MSNRSISWFRFNSLRTGKPIQSGRNRNRRNRNRNQFQFPTDGKAYPKWHYAFNQRFNQRRSFNSLRTGKPIQSGKGEIKRFRKDVSIPYGRESLSKEGRWRRCCRIVPQFQFPTDGKAYPKWKFKIKTSNIQIPCFNSLRTGKPIQSYIFYVDNVIS